MHLVYILNISTVLILDESLNISGAIKAHRTYRPDPIMTRCNRLLSTPHGLPRFIDDAFETDGLGCFRLLAWIENRYRDARPQTQKRKFDALFDADPSDAIKAAARIYAGTDTFAPGESGYFCAVQWTNHPKEMAAIAALGALNLAPTE